MAIDILSKLNTGGSGLDLVSLSTDLAAATYEPRKAVVRDRMDRAEMSASALDRVAAGMADLSDTLSFARNIDLVTVQNSAPTAIGVTLTDAARAPARPVEIEVLGLAQSQVLEFTGFSGPDAVLGGGRLTIDIGRWAGDPPAFTADPARSGATLTVPAGATLTELAETLSAIPGVTARAIEVEGGSWSLGILSDTGRDNSLRISASPDASPDIAALDFSADPTPVERRMASDALLTVDGIAVLRPGNEIDDLVPGLSLSLTATTTSPATLRSTSDTDTALAVMDTLVEALNGLKSLLRQVTARGTGGTEPGDLAGDAAIQSLARDFDALVAGGLQGFGARPVFLSDFGLRTERDGRLTLDRDAFERRFAADPALFRSVLQDNLAGTGPDVTIDGMPAKGATPGRYDLVRDPATGAATLGGIALTVISAADGQTSYRAPSGPLAGLRLTLDDSVTATQVDFGQSLATRLADWIDSATGRDGTLGRRQERLATALSEDALTIEGLTAEASAYETRMRNRFAEMERVITQLNSTGDYITNLIDSFNAQT